MKDIFRKILSKRYKYKVLINSVTDIIIFDEHGSKEIKDNIINKSIKTTTYDYNVITIYLNPIFIAKLIINLFKHWNSYKSIPHNFYILYILTDIKTLKPKIVITYNDDNIIYHSLANIMTDIKFIAIQNGLRESFIRERVNYNINHDTYFCFGEKDIDKQLSSNWKIKKAIPIGSVKAGIALSMFKEQQKTYDICYISEYSSEDKITNENLEWANNIKKVDKIISNFYKNHKNIKIIVVLRSNNNNERDYFKNLFDPNISFSNPLRYLDSYKTILQSNLSIGFGSTLLVESLGLKTKSLGINTAKSNKFFDYDEIVYNFDDDSSCTKFIIDLIDMPYQKYYEKMQSTIIKSMNLDIHNLPHNIIRKNIDNLIYNSKNG